jgi:hypothetical protein
MARTAPGGEETVVCLEGLALAMARLVAMARFAFSALANVKQAEHARQLIGKVEQLAAAEVVVTHFR